MVALGNSDNSGCTSSRALGGRKVNTEPFPKRWNSWGVTRVLILVAGANRSWMGVGGEGKNELSRAC